MARTVSLALLGLALLGVARPAGLRAQDQRLTARLDSTTRAQIELLADSARAAGLPDEPLVQKALEGASKRAPGPRIVAAAAHVLESLRGARGVLGPRATSDELVAGAASLRAGAAPAMLRDLQQLGPRDGLAVPLAVLTDLVASGVAVDAAWRSVERLAQRGARDTEFLELRDRMDREASGVPASRSGAPAFRMAAEGLLSQAESFGEGAEGTIAAAIFPAGIVGLRPEIAGSVSATAHDRAYSAHSWDVAARLHTANDRRGLWAGAGVGYSAAHRAAQAGRRLDLGGWTRLGPTTLRVWMAQASFDDSLRAGSKTTWRTPPFDTLATGDPRSGSTSTTTPHFLRSYTDLGSRIAIPLLDRYEIEASLTRRFGREYRATAWRLGGTMWLGGNVALVAAAGHAAPDLPAALPGGRYTTVGLRFAFGTGSSLPSVVVPPARRSTDDAPATVVVRNGGRLFVVAPGAQAVETMGDFTDWQPQALVRVADGQWEYPRPLAAGVHQFNVRLDGGAWIVPAGAGTMDDGFGGRTGVVVVPR